MHFKWHAHFVARGATNQTELIHLINAFIASGVAALNCFHTKKCVSRINAFNTGEVN